MRRQEVEKRIRKVAKAKGVVVEFVEGGSHTKVTFDGKFVVTIPRHNEINELTAKGLLRDAESWEGELT